MMWTTIPKTHKASWTPDHWCVALLQLSREVGTGTESVTPARWLYLLWEPSDRALPYREPDMVSMTNDEPWPLIEQECDGAPVYQLLDDECDWPTWLDMLLHFPEQDDWTTALLHKARQEKQQAMRTQWLRRYQKVEAASGLSVIYPGEAVDGEPDFGDFGRLGTPRITASELPAQVEIDEALFNPHCSCIRSGNFEEGLVSDGYLQDWQAGEWGAALLHRCAGCRRIWIRLVQEDKYTSTSGGWCMGRITADMAKRIAPDLVVSYMAALPWYWCGGEYFEGETLKRSGKP